MKRTDTGRISYHVDSQLKSVETEGLSPKEERKGRHFGRTGDWVSTLDLKILQKKEGEDD